MGYDCSISIALCDQKEEFRKIEEQLEASLDGWNVEGVDFTDKSFSVFMQEHNRTVTELEALLKPLTETAQVTFAVSWEDDFDDGPFQFYVGARAGIYEAIDDIHTIEECLKHLKAKMKTEAGAQAIAQAFSERSSWAQAMITTSLDQLE